jgi:hypothetical protein
MTRFLLAATPKTAWLTPGFMIVGIMGLVFLVFAPNAYAGARNSAIQHQK